MYSTVSELSLSKEDWYSFINSPFPIMPFSITAHSTVSINITAPTRRPITNERTKDKTGTKNACELSGNIWATAV